MRGLYFKTKPMNIKFLAAENKYIVHYDGLYLKSIKNKKCQLTTIEANAKRFDNVDEAEFFYDVFTEKHLQELAPSKNEIKLFFGLVFGVGLVFAIFLLCWLFRLK